MSYKQDEVETNAYYEEYLEREREDERIDDKKYYNKDAYWQVPVIILGLAGLYLGLTFFITDVMFHAYLLYDILGISKY